MLMTGSIIQGRPKLAAQPKPHCWLLQRKIRQDLT